MPNTTHNLPYPAPTDPVASGAANIQALATALDTRLLGYGTTLPASPVDGQEFVLVDSLTAPTFVWHLRYNAGNTTAYKWEFIGGAAYNAFGSGLSLGSAATWLPLLGYQVPRAGIYALMPSYYGSCGATAASFAVAAGVQNAVVGPTLGQLTAQPNTYVNVAGNETAVTVPTAANYIQVMGQSSQAQAAGNVTAVMALKPKFLA